MDLEQLLEVVDHLSAADKNKLKAHLVKGQKPAKPRTVEDCIAELEDISREFKGTSSDEEMSAIVEAINTKSKPSEKGL